MKLKQFVVVSYPWISDQLQVIMTTKYLKIEIAEIFNRK